MPSTRTDVSALRRFNRAWAQRVGVLEESFLGTGRGPGPARLLFEIRPDGATVRDLRRRLGLDSGYLSRLLRQLEDDALVRVRTDPADARRRLVTPTEAGRRAWHDLEDRSQQLARELLAPLTPRQRERLDEALGTAELLIRAAMVQLEEVEPTSTPAVDAVRRYVAELDDRFPGGFDPGPALLADANALRRPTGTFTLAVSDGQPVACGGVQGIEDGVGEIKRMWVDPDWRGAGLGHRLLRHLESETRRLGYGVVRLDTNATLVEAIAMYERAGYRRIPRYNDNPFASAWFQKPL